MSPLPLLHAEIVFPCIVLIHTLFMLLQSLLVYMCVSFVVGRQWYFELILSLWSYSLSFFSQSLLVFFMLVLSLEDNEILNSYCLSGHTVFLFLLPKRFLILKGRDLLKIFNPALNNTKSLSLVSSHFQIKDLFTNYSPRRSFVGDFTDIWV